MNLLMLTLIIAGGWTDGGSRIQRKWLGYMRSYEEGDSVYEHITTDTSCYYIVSQIPETVFDTGWPAAQMVVVDNLPGTPVVMRYMIIRYPGCWFGKLPTGSYTWGTSLFTEIEWCVYWALKGYTEEDILRIWPYKGRDYLSAWGRPGSPASVWNFWMYLMEYPNYAHELDPWHVYLDPPYRPWDLETIPQDTLP